MIDGTETPWRNPKNDIQQDGIEERIYPCAECGTLRSKAEGGTVFTVCDDCWDKKHPEPKP